MKKTIASVMVIAMMMGVVGCAATDNKETTVAQTTTAAAQETTQAQGETKEDIKDETKEETAEPTTAQEVAADTLGQKLAQTFKAEASTTTNVNDLATKLADAELTGYDCGVMEVSEGYLNGFSDEIKGFSSASMFSPWIGSVPFVGYVFETSDPEALKATLLANADPRWNICTEAAETVVEISGNLVFFTMCPGEDELVEY